MARRPLRASSQAATYYYQTNHSNIEAIPLSALPKNTTSELAAYLHTIFVIAERQQGSCEYQLVTNTS